MTDLHDAQALSEKDSMTVFVESDARIASRQQVRRKPSQSMRELQRRDLKTLIEDASSQRANAYAPATIRLYVGSLGLIRELVYQNRELPDQGDHRWIGKALKVIAKLEAKYSELETQKLALQALFVAAQQLYKERRKRVFREAAETYKERMAGVIERIQERRDSHSMSARERLKFMAWPEILQKTETYCRRWDALKRQEGRMLPIDLRTLQDLLLVSCYTAIEPLRNEWCKVQIRNFDVAKDNFIKFGGEAVTVVMNEFKTAKTYGPLSLDLPEPLASMIRRWRTESDSDFLFVKVTGQPYSSANWSQQCSRTFERVTGRGLTSQILRKSFSTYQLEQSQMPTNAQLIPIRESARRMGHTLSTHLHYRRLEGDRDALIANVQQAKKTSSSVAS